MGQQLWLALATHFAMKMWGEGQKKTHDINVKVHTNSGRNQFQHVYTILQAVYTKKKNGLFLVLLSIEGKNAKPFSFAIGPWFLPQCLAVWDALTLMKFDWVTTNCPPRYRSEMQNWSYPPTFEFAPSGVFTPRQFNNVCGFPELVLQQFETVIGSG